MKKLIIFIILLSFTVNFYSQSINPNGNTIIERFNLPEGYERISAEENSFAKYLKNFPLKKYGSPVFLYNGEEKRNKVYVSVFDFPLLKTDLIQCADAVLKLRAEYFYENKNYSEIKFHITNGMLVPFERFIYGGSPGHVVLVLDVAINKKTGKKIMLLGQSYMPSQEFHILKSYENINPWYYIEDDILETPEWTFEKGSLMEFSE